MLLQTSSIRIPTLEHNGLRIWDVLAIAEYLEEMFPDACMIPTDVAARVRCRSISGEMHSGFSRASLGIAGEPERFQAEFSDLVRRARRYRPGV